MESILQTNIYLENKNKSAVKLRHVFGPEIDFKTSKPLFPLKTRIPTFGSIFTYFVNFPINKQFQSLSILR
jgi:hypothetical protein